MRVAPRIPKLIRLASFALIFLWRSSTHSQRAQAGAELAALETECLAAETAERCKSALPVCKRAAAAKEREKESRERDLALATLSNHAFRCDYQLGQYAVAEQHARHALALRQKWLGAHPEVANSINRLANALMAQGKYLEAESFHRQALTLRRKLLGAEHLDVASSLNNLATVLDNQGKHVEAEGLYRQVLALHQKLLGAEHPLVATSVNNLAAVLQEQGKYPEAEGPLRQALALHKKLLGAEHPLVALSIGNLATVLDDQGKYAEAEQLHRQALTLFQKLQGAEHPDVAIYLNNLANALRDQGKYPEAEQLHRQALALRQKLLGADHPDIASSLFSVASVLKMLGKYPEAEGLSRQALTLRRKLLGAEHPEVASSIHLLAILLRKQGHLTEAEKLHRQALALRQKLLGSEHPDIAESLNSLSVLLVERGERHAAILATEKASSIREGQLRGTVSETRMQALLQSLRDEEDWVYSLLRFHASAPAAQRLALTLALLRKGRAMEAGVQANRLLHQNLTAVEVRKQFDDWQAIRQRRETLLNREVGNLKPADYQARLKELQLQAESLEAQLAQAIPGIRSLQPPSFDDILPAVAKRIPKQGILVEVVSTRTYQLRAKDDDHRWGAPRYVAMLFTGDQHIASMDLGPASDIDALGRILRDGMRPGSDPMPAAQAMYRRIFMPLLPHLVGKRELFLSLDGSLQLVPFDALHDGTGYLLGKYRFHYLTSGRDLLYDPSQRMPGPALVLANPDFGAVEPAAPLQAPSIYQRIPYLPPLLAAQREAEQIARWLGIRPLLGSAAREDAIHDAHAPWVAHLATHGMFLDDVELSVSANSRSSLRPLMPTPIEAPAMPKLETLDELPGESGAMNRSALLLAGIRQGDHAKSPLADGLLTAENSRNLDLDGTQLVTLSACETGQGTMSAGQGIYGLRRAFLVAGAETVVTSLWRVDDQATGELMTMYYQKLLDPKKPGDRLGSMVEAMQELRSRPGRSHPYYWAPFLVIGQDGPLRRPAAFASPSP